MIKLGNQFIKTWKFGFLDLDEGAGAGANAGGVASGMTKLGLIILRLTKNQKKT